MSVTYPGFFEWEEYTGNFAEQWPTAQIDEICWQHITINLVTTVYYFALHSYAFENPWV